MIGQDFRYALRSLAGAPGFTAIVILTLAFGIGANTAIFSFVDAVLLRPLPFRDADRLVLVWQVNKHDRSAPAFFNSYSDFQSFQSRSSTLDHISVATWAVAGKTFSGHGPARDVFAMPVSLDYFAMIGRSPAIGRTFDAADLRRGCSAVLRDRFWRGSLSANQEVIGQAIQLDDQPCTVIGVMPPDVTFFPDAISMWTLITPLNPIARDPAHAAVGIFAHLRPGSSISTAQNELERIFSETHRGDGLAKERVPVVHPLQEQFAYLTSPNLRLSLLVLFAAVSSVLLIACLKVANLLLVRFELRQRELAVRTALGSGRGRLIRQLLTESLMLSATGSAAGIALAAGAIRLFNVINPVQMPPGNSVMINLAVLLYTCGLAIATTVLFGLVPAWRSTRIDLNESLKAASRSASRSLGSQGLIRMLVAVEITLSVVLLIGAGLLIRSVDRLTSVSLGFEPEHLISFDVSLPSWRYPSAANREQLYAKLLARLRERAGPDEIGLASSLPVNGGRFGGHALVVSGRTAPDADHADRDVASVQISPNYFHLMGVGLRAGRVFSADDSASSNKVAIINEALAKKYFPRGSPIGQSIRFEESSNQEQSSWWTIAGVVSDERESDFFHEMSWRGVPCVFRPIAQDPPGSLAVLLRSQADAGPLATVLRREAMALDPQAPVGEIESMPVRLEHLFAYPRFRAVLLGAFAALALLLAALGLYGVLAQMVRQRTHEIGIRMAVGAQRRNVVLIVVTQAMRLVGIGIICGLALAWPLTRLLKSLWYGVTGTDPLTLSLVVMILAGVAFFATYMPARRAASVDPSIVLRYE